MNNYSHLSNRSSKKVIFGLCLLFIGFGTYQRFFTPIEFNPHSNLWSDPGRHWNYAIMIDPSPITATDNIGYQLWLSVIARITGADPLALGIYAGLLSAITPWIWYRFFREAVADKSVALIGWAIIACLPSWIGIYSYFMTETLFLPLFGLALWFTWRALRKKTFMSFILSGTFWILAVITRQFCVLPAGIAIARLLLINEERKRKIVSLLILAICIFTPIAYRSYRLIGVFSPVPYKPFDVIMFLSGREGITMHIADSEKRLNWYYQFGSASTFIKPFEPLSNWQSSRFGTGNEEIYIDLAHGAKDWSSALLKSWKGSSTFFRMWTENMLILLFSESWPDCNPNHAWEQFQIRLSFFWGPFFMIVVACNIFNAYKRKRIDFLPAFVMAVWFGCLLIPYIPVEGRYRKPLEGLLIANALWLISPRKIPSDDHPFAELAERTQ